MLIFLPTPQILIYMEGKIGQEWRMFRKVIISCDVRMRI